MARYDIWDLDITPDVAEHIWRHGLKDQDVDSVLDDDYLVRPNRSGRRASHQSIGRDRQGRCLTVPIVRTDTYGTWRVVTAWPCKAAEATSLRRYQGR